MKKLHNTFLISVLLTCSVISPLYAPSKSSLLPREKDALPDSVRKKISKLPANLKAKDRRKARQKILNSYQTQRPSSPAPIPAPLPAPDKDKTQIVLQLAPIPAPPPAPIPAPPPTDWELESMKSDLRHCSYVLFNGSHSDNLQQTTANMNRLGRALKESGREAVRINASFSAPNRGSSSSESIFPYLSVANMKKFGEVIASSDVIKITVNNTGWQPNMRYTLPYIEDASLSVFLSTLTSSSTLKEVDIEGVFTPKQAGDFCSAFKGTLPFTLKFIIPINTNVVFGMLDYYVWNEEAARIRQDNTAAATMLRKRFGPQVTFDAPTYYYRPYMKDRMVIWHLPKELGNVGTSDQDLYNPYDPHDPHDPFYDPNYGKPKVKRWWWEL